MCNLRAVARKYTFYVHEIRNNVYNMDPDGPITSWPFGLEDDVC